MLPPSPTPDRRFALRWIVRTFLGYLLGVVLAIVLVVLADGAGLEGATFMLGIGVGTGVGLVQGRMLRPWLGPARRWILPTALGLTIPFAASDALNVAGLTSFPLAVCVALGGLLAGVLQQRALRPHAERGGWWVVTSAVGWSAAAGTVALSDGVRFWFPPGPATAPLVLLLWFAGGPLLGAAGAVSLLRMRLRAAA